MVRPVCFQFVKFLTCFLLLSTASCRKSYLISHGSEFEKNNIEIGVNENDELNREKLSDDCEDLTIIKQLPGQPPVDFMMRSGYIPVNEESQSERALFYWFVAAANSPDTAPLTLWLTGGPGCSSVGSGAFSELGPFYPNKDGKTLQINRHSWNSISNFIFLESPAGVGFSYFADPADNDVGDKRTAEDTWRFLIGFYQAYPEFSNRTFYITGESYAGHYIPQLANTIVEKNKDASNFQIPLKGFSVGNAWTDTVSDNRGAALFWWSHALISDSTLKGIMSYCNFSETGPLHFSKEKETKSSASSFSSAVSSHSSSSSSNSRSRKSDYEVCEDFCDSALFEMGYPLISIYDIYSDVCTGSHMPKHALQLASKLRRFPKRSLVGRSLSETPQEDPCVDDEVEAYMNLPEVREAFHVRNSSYSAWVECSDTLNYSGSDVLTSVLPLYTKLLREGLRIWVYSGDVDAIVPVTGTRDWLSKLNLNLVTPWKPWFLHGQVGGYVTQYENLTFTTVREAGHMVPYTQPARGLHLFSTFISGSTLA